MGKNKLLKPNLNKLAKILEMAKKTTAAKRTKVTKPIVKQKLRKVKRIERDVDVVSENRERPKSRPTLRDRMLKQLKKAKFRLINQEMNRNEDTTTEPIDMDTFRDYHDGYENQMDKWAVKPVNVVIETIRGLPETHIVADMGCGPATLAEAVPHTVHSFDLRPLNDRVTECDMAHTPLANAAVNVCVFSLSLMAIAKLKDYFIEANRILKFGGLLVIAELESRIDNIDAFVLAIENYGFSLAKKDCDRKFFHFFQFIKVTNLKKNSNFTEIPLKAYVYKKR